MDKTVPKGAALLLDFIREIETGKSDRTAYDVIYGHNQAKLPKPLTTMTIGDIVDAQKSWTKRFKSSACGAYQFMRTTLIDLSKELGLQGNQVFTPDLQDRLGYHLLKRRGYDAYMAAKIDRNEFAKRLAQEWASLPVLQPIQGAHRKLVRGQSYYAGDGLNKSLVDPVKVETVLVLVRKAPDEPAKPLTIPEPAKPAEGITPKPQQPQGVEAAKGPENAPEGIAPSWLARLAEILPLIIRKARTWARW